MGERTAGGMRDGRREKGRRKRPPAATKTWGPQLQRWHPGWAQSPDWSSFDVGATGWKALGTYPCSAWNGPGIAAGKEGHASAIAPATLTVDTSTGNAGPSRYLAEWGCAAPSLRFGDPLPPRCCSHAPGAVADGLPLRPSYMEPPFHSTTGRLQLRLRLRLRLQCTTRLYLAHLHGWLGIMGMPLNAIRVMVE
jgi:hypothetical protein